VFTIFLPWLYYWLFIGLKGQTLGKMAVGIKVVNAEGYMPGLGIAALPPSYAGFNLKYSTNETAHKNNNFGTQRGNPEV